MEAKKYTYEEVYEMLGGTEYHPECQIRYVYHMSNGEEEEAKQYFDELNKYNLKLKKMKETMEANEKLKLPEPEIEKNNIDNNNDEQ